MLTDLNFTGLNIADENMFVQLRAKVISTRAHWSPNSRRLIATVEDESGQIDLVGSKGLKWMTE